MTKRYLGAVRCPTKTAIPKRKQETPPRGWKNPEPAALLSESVALVEAISTELRTISYLLHPPLLEELGLVSALRSLVDGFSQHTGIETSLRLDHELKWLPAEMEISTYRIVQECLNNVHRHSGSPTAVVRIERGPVGVEVLGRGLPTQPNNAGFGVGLRGMRERAAQLGGTLEIKSNGKGTRVIARLPLSKESLTPGRNGHVSR